MSYAFNSGSDARIAGLPLENGPVEKWAKGDDDFRNEWKRGWLQCHSEWGLDARGYVRPLPPVREVA